MTTLMKNGEYKQLKEITVNESKFDDGIDIFNTKIKINKNKSSYINKNYNIYNNNNHSNKNIFTTNSNKYRKGIALWKDISKHKAFPKELIYTPKYTLIDKHIPSIYFNKPSTKQQHHSIHLNKSI